jgi:sulfate adenylyltransferase subunit 2
MNGFTHLRQLEAESIHIFREVAAECQRPVLLYSIGKDSSVLLRLAQKAFYPGQIPFPLLHIDTGYKFREMIEFRDRYTAELGLRLIVHTNRAALNEGANPFAWGTQRCCGALKTTALLDGLREGGFDAAIGGARRDEERSRAKERIFSFRNERGQWDPRNQRPELWNLFNAHIHNGESLRVFPLSNWTELDIWQYISDEQIELPSIYFAHDREVFRRDGMWLSIGEHNTPREGEEVVTLKVRFRTVGDAPITGAVESSADTYEAIVAEVAATRMTERGATRADDRLSEAAMEDRKKEGYF